MTSSLIGMFVFGLLGNTFIGLPLNFVGFPYDREIARRIPPPRFMRHYEYRLWCALMFFTQAAVFLLSMLGGVFLVYLLSIRANSPVAAPANAPFPAALGYFAVGVVAIVLPMLAFGISFDRRVRADGPEPPAAAAEVKALRRYLGVVLSVLVVLVAAVSVLAGAVG